MTWVHPKEEMINLRSGSVSESLFEPGQTQKLMDEFPLNRFQVSDRGMRSSDCLDAVDSTKIYDHTRRLSGGPDTAEQS